LKKKGGPALGPFTGQEISRRAFGVFTMISDTG
jgi:hypothetical protein